jgi:MIF4G domain
MSSSSSSGNNKKAYQRNRSFGGSGSSGHGTTPTSPNTNKKKGGNQPARRSNSHDPQKLKAEVLVATMPVDDDGFTAIGSTTKNTNVSSTTPRGRMNPTAGTFSRPRNTQSFNKPRPTGSFKKPRDNNNNNNNSNHGNNNNKREDTVQQRRTNSFHKPRPTNSFNNNHRNNNTNNNTNNSFDNAPPLSPNNSNANSAAAKRELYRRSTSRLTAYDVELYTEGDGKTPAQRSVIRLHVDVMMRARLTNMDPPSFLVLEQQHQHQEQQQQQDQDCWNPHSKCLWNDPTRRDQIEQFMQKYPNAIPLHLKKRTRIISSKLGDPALLVNVSSSASLAAGSIVSTTGGAGDDNNNTWERDDSSLGTSLRSNSEQPSFVNDAGSVSMASTTMEEEDMNPLRKTLLLLNKLSWTTIDKLTPRLFAILEEDVPKLTMPPVVAIVKPDDTTQDNTTTASTNNNTTDTKQPDVLPMVMTILTMIVEKSQTEPHFSAMYAQLCKNLAERNTAWKRKMLAHCQSEFEHDTAWHIARLDEHLAAKAITAINNNNKDGVAATADGAATAPPMEDVSSFTNATAEDMDRDYLVLQLRKKYLGHVQFLGELFKLQLIKLDILIWCLSRLLFSKEQADEDDLECFAKLMTVVGGQAESLVLKGKCHAMAEEKWYQCWDHVYLLTGKQPKKNKQSASKPGAADDVDASKKVPPSTSSRIKFMLVDLLELQENGTLQRGLQRVGSFS